METLKRAWKWFAALFARVAHAPPRGVYRWQGRTSIITWAIAWAFAIARFVSPLQWLKLLVRRGRQGRPDFHAADTENYFLGLLVVFLIWLGLERAGLIPAFGDWPHDVTSAAKLVIQVLLFESFVWLSYYCLWRNFMEPNYTLYHPAEYLVLFPVIVGVQVLALARVVSASVSDVTGWMLGGQSNDHDYPLGLMGWFYIAILLSNLRGMIPRPNFKRNANTLVIGAGDVAVHRLLPAMRKAMGQSAFEANVAIASIEDPARPAEATSFNIVERKDTEAILSDARVSAGAAIIATPSDRHMVYLKPLIEGGLRVVCEKPLSSVRAEIDELNARRASYRECVFALSYYVLEKALPLTFLLEGNRAHQPYLTVKRTDTVGTKELVGDEALDEIQSMRGALGAVTQISISLIEGVERSPTAGKRSWTEAPGGLMYETMIHPLLLMVKAQRALAPNRWGGVSACLHAFNPTRTRGRSTEANKPRATTFLRLRQAAAQGAPEIDLIVSKYAPDASKQRRCVIKCDKGEIECDFGTKTLVAKITGQAWTLAIAVKDEYAGNYAVQTALALRFIKDGWTSSRYDDFDDQIDVLTWMSLRAAQYESGAAFTYASKGRQKDFDEAIA